MILIIYVQDALRADHMSCYGYFRKTTPHIEKFCEESVVFTRAYAQSTWTRTSATTLLTSLYPSVLGIEGIDSVFPSVCPTLPAILRRAGFYTIGLSANPNISSYYGYARGFNKFIDLFLSKNLKKISYSSTPRREKVERIKSRRIVFPRGEEINNYLKSNLKELIKYKKNLFIFIWALDTHEPFNPPYRKFSIHNKRKEISVRDFRKLKTKEDRKELINLYDDEILYVDYCFNEFIEILKEHSIYDDSLIIFTSDHGQLLLEHGMIGHGHIPYEPTLRIPLIIKFPYQKFKAKVNEPVGLIDILPTIIDVLKLKYSFPVKIEGISLISLIRKEIKIYRDLFSETKSWNVQAKFYSLLSDDWKYILVLPPNRNIKYYKEILKHFIAIENIIDFIDNPTYYIKRVVNKKKEMLFNIKIDPFESKDLSIEKLNILKIMRKKMLKWLLIQQKKKKKLQNISQKIHKIKAKLNK